MGSRFRSLLIDTVTVQNDIASADVDRYGNPTPGVESFDSPARVQPVSSAEDILDRDTRVTRFLVFLPAATRVNGLSRLVWEGRTLKVWGEPRTIEGRWRPHHIELEAREVIG